MIAVKREDVASLSPECAENVAARLAEIELKFRHMIEYLDILNAYRAMVREAKTERT